MTKAEHIMLKLAAVNPQTFSAAAAFAPIDSSEFKEVKRRFAEWGQQQTDYSTKAYKDQFIKLNSLYERYPKQQDNLSLRMHILSSVYKNAKENQTTKQATVASTIGEFLGRAASKKSVQRGGAAAGGGAAYQAGKSDNTSSAKKMSDQPWERTETGKKVDKVWAKTKQVGGGIRDIAMAPVDAVTAPFTRGRSVGQSIDRAAHGVKQIKGALPSIESGATKKPLNNPWQINNPWQKPWRR